MGSLFYPNGFALGIARPEGADYFIPKQRCGLLAAKSICALKGQLKLMPRLGNIFNAAPNIVEFAIQYHILILTCIAPEQPRLGGICNAAPGIIEFAIQYYLHNYIPNSNRGLW